MIKMSGFFLGLALCGTSAFGEILNLERASVPAAHGMYLKSQNEIWLADTFKKLSSKSQVYDLNGNVVKTTASGKGMAGIAKHPSQELYSFCDVMGSQVHWMDASGKKIHKFLVPNPWSARWTPSGEAMFVVTFSGSVLRISGKNAKEQIISGLDAPFDVAPVGETTLWISEQGEVGTGRVCRYNRASNSDVYEKVVCNKNIDLDNPEGLWPLADGSVVVVDTARGTLVKISTDGSAKILEEGLGIPILVQLLEQGKWVIFTNQSSAGPALIFGQSKELL